MKKWIIKYLLDLHWRSRAPDLVFYIGLDRRQDPAPRQSNNITGSENYLVNFTRRMPQLKFDTSGDCNTPRSSRLNGRFSDRYNLATSLRAASTSLATRKPTRPAEGQKHRNWSKLDLHSPDYNDMIDTETMLFQTRWYKRLVWRLNAAPVSLAHRQ
jgi:hypothetical protein